MKKNNYYFFTIDPVELEKQLNEHDTLSVTKSVRGVAALTMIALLFLGVLIILGFTYFDSSFPISIADVVISLLIYAPLIYFTYKGHIWAIIGLGLFYTFDKIVTGMFLTGNVNFSGVGFWLIGIGPLWVAWKVERIHRRQKHMHKKTEI